ncbi:MAG: HAD family phosphatase, partial [Pseudomonadota bacterium]
VNLARLQLTRPGLITVSRNDVVEGKPAAEPYLRAAHLLGVRPDEAIVVEDSNVGLAAGTAAGMRSVAVPWSQPHVGTAENRLASMDDLAALF